MDSLTKWSEGNGYIAAIAEVLKLAQAKNAVIVVPSDTTDLVGDSDFTLYVGSAGNVRVTTLGGQTLTIPNINAGSFLPIRVVRVWSAGTTASNIVALY